MRAPGLVAAVAALLVPLGGCLQQDDPAPCATVAACLLGPGLGSLPVVVHLSDGMDLHPEAWTAFSEEAQALTGRNLFRIGGSAIAPQPGEVDEGALHAMDTGSVDASVLQVFVVNSTHLVGEEPASGLSFPGLAPIFVFPRTLDFRVAQAGLGEAAEERARVRLEVIVLVHELGHVLGLVGCGMPMVRPHADPAAACHSGNASSIMHSRVAHVDDWPAWDATEPLSPFAWDEDDRADISAYKAKLRR